MSRASERDGERERWEERESVMTCFYVVVVLIMTRHFTLLLQFNVLTLPVWVQFSKEEND